MGWVYSLVTDFSRLLYCLFLENRNLTESLLLTSQEEDEFGNGGRSPFLIHKAFEGN